MSFSFNIREQIIIGVTAIVLILVIFGLLVFKPQYDRFSDTKKRQVDEISKQQERQVALDNLKAAKKDAASTEAKSLSLSKKMPEEADLPSILVELDELGKENNVKVIDITPTTLTAASGYSTVPIELKVGGSFFNITDFIYNIVKLPREYTLGDVSIEPSDQGYPLLGGTIKVNTYVYSPGSTATGQTGQSGTTGSTEATPTTTTPKTEAQ